MTVVIVKTFHDRIEAEIAKSKLKAQGIDSHISANDAGGAFPAPMSASPGVKLKVREADVEKAKDLLKTHEKDH